MPKYIFIVGGVVSSLGKGIASASIGALLQARGYKVRTRKMDPYLNVDPGAMSPYQHGEVFVTDDGAETDLDLGHYERFVGTSCRKTDTISGGRIFNNVLTKERNGDYLGATVQMIPHVTNEMKLFMDNDITDEDFVLYEIGGTIGDIEGNLFLEAARQFANEKGRENVLFVLLTLLPYIDTAGELKTKPTQHAVKKLLESGIQADILLCRSKMMIPAEERRKLALFCNVSPDDVVCALDVDNLYKIPLAYHEQGLDTQVLKHFHLLENAPALDISKWQKIVDTIEHTQKEVHVGVVGKYCGLPDAYKSLKEALVHAGFANNCHVKVDWVNSEELETLTDEEVKNKLSVYDGVLVPGGFGYRGTEGKIKAIHYARENEVPFFGICLGMQMAVIEASRNLLGIKDAGSTEFEKPCTPVVNLMQIYEQDGKKYIRPANGELGSTKRIGAHPCIIKEGSIASACYNGATEISERHRHHYEIDINLTAELEEKGIVFSGKSPDGLLPEIIEMPKHPFFIASQFQPEFKSRPFEAHPLFTAFIKATLEQKA